MGYCSDERCELSHYFLTAALCHLLDVIVGPRTLFCYILSFVSVFMHENLE